MTTHPSATVDSLRQVIAETISIDAQELLQRIGSIVVASSDDALYGELLKRTNASGDAMALYDRGDQQRDPATVFFADRIPAGIAEQAILREIVRLHGRNVNPADWELLAHAPEAWDTWGAKSPERRIYEAVSDRIRKSKSFVLPPKRETRFIFSLQEAVAKGVEPARDGRGVEGWLYTVFDTVRESVYELVGRDLSAYAPRDFVKLLQIGTPFGAEIEAMKVTLRSESRHQKRLSLRVGRMDVLDAKFAGMHARSEATDGASVPVDREGALWRRIAELTVQLADAKDAIEVMASPGHDGRWYVGSYLGDDVTSSVVPAMSPRTMNSALWDLKELVGVDTQLKVPSFKLSEIEEAAYAGLASAVGSTGERDALKSILSRVQHAMDAGVDLAAGELIGDITMCLPVEQSTALDGGVHRELSEACLPLGVCEVKELDESPGPSM